MFAASQRSQDGFRSSHLTRRWRQLKQPVRRLLFLGIGIIRSQVVSEGSIGSSKAYFYVIK